MSILCLCTASLPVHHWGAQWWCSKNPWCQRGRCLEGVLWGDSSGDSWRVCHEIRSRVHLSGHDVSASCYFNQILFYITYHHSDFTLMAFRSCVTVFRFFSFPIICEGQVNTLDVIFSTPQPLCLLIIKVHVPWGASCDEHPACQHQCLLCPHNPVLKQCFCLGQICCIKLWSKSPNNRNYIASNSECREQLALIRETDLYF